MSIICSGPSALHDGASGWERSNALDRPSVFSQLIERLVPVLIPDFKHTVLHCASAIPPPRRSGQKPGGGRFPIQALNASVQDFPAVDIFAPPWQVFRGRARLRTHLHGEMPETHGSVTHGTSRDGFALCVFPARGKKFQGFQVQRDLAESACSLLQLGFAQRLEGFDGVEPSQDVITFWCLRS